MRNLVLVSISDCNEKTGIATFLDIFRNQIDFFAQHGFRLSFECYKNKSMTVGGLSKMQESRGRKTLKSIFQFFGFTSFLLFFNAVIKRGFIIAVRLRKYQGDTVFFFQDFYVAYLAHLLLPGPLKNVLILHSGKDPFKHLFYYFPKLENSLYGRGIRSLARKAMEKADIIIVLNENFKESLEKEIQKRVLCIYSSLPQDTSLSIQSKKNNDKIQIVAVGSLQSIKGYDLLLGAIRHLPKNLQGNLNCQILGGGPLRNSLEGISREFNLENVVHFLGESDEVPRYLRQADIYILPSRDEGLPLALVEAAAAGLPIIATDVGSIREIFQDSIILVSPDVNQISNALKVLLTSETLRAALGARSRSVFEKKLALNVFLHKYLDVFNLL